MNTIKASDRILSLGLALCLLLGMVVYLPGPVEVHAVDIGTGDDLTAGADLTGTGVYFGSYNNSPILWHVVETDGNTAVLWTTTNMGNKAYDSSNDHKYWKDSEICLWLNGTSSGNFLHDAFQQAEQDAIADYGTTEQANPALNMTTLIDIDQKIVLPSVEEIGTGTTTGTWDISYSGTTNDGRRALGGDWWLRSPGLDSSHAALVPDHGIVNPAGTAADTVDNNLGIRPAFRLNLSSVLFTSDASGASKSITAGDSLESARAPTGAVKLTVVDDTMSISNISVDTVMGNNIDFFYTTNGSYDSLSAIVQKADGRISYYGRLEDNPSGSGNASVKLPTGLDPTDQLLVFVEKINGVNETDYASEPVALVPALKITTQPGNESVTEGDPAAFSVTASGYNLTYQWQMSTDGGGTFTDISSETSDSYSISATAAALNGNQYRVVVKDGFGREAASDTALLTVQSLSTAKEITAFTIPNQQGNTAISDIDNATGTIDLTMPTGTDVTSLTPTITHTGVNISPASGVAQDFTNPVTYTVTAADSSTKDYVVTITVAANDTKEIIGFTIANQQGSTTIDHMTETITLTMPTGTDVTNLTPTITHTGVSVSPASGVPQDFTNPVTYTVTAQDNSTKSYVVTVDVASAPPDPGSAPSVSTTSLSVDMGGANSFFINLGSGADGADSANISSNDTAIAQASPTQLTTSGEVVVTGVSVDTTTISIGYSGGARDNQTDTVTITVKEPGNGNNGNGNGSNGGGNQGSGTSGSRSTSRDRSSGGGSTYTPPPKTTLPASAFSWEGRTLTIDHDSITPLGLLSVQWDGKALTRGTDYGVYQGSVIVRFSEDFMAAQSPGDHTVRVEFLNHTGETTVTVGETGLTTEEPNDDLFDNNTYNPNTGGYPDGSYPATDNPNTGDGRGIWFALLLGSIGAAVLVKLRPRLEVK